MKFQSTPGTVLRWSRSRLGAWIEIMVNHCVNDAVRVAPVWERGLKFLRPTIKRQSIRRSRLGAWIEIEKLYGLEEQKLSLPFGSVD